MPEGAPVLDLTEVDIATALGTAVWAVGRYNERRETVYAGFYHGNRNIHMGVDLFGPVGTEVRSFADGEIVMAGMNGKPGDYGPTLICKYTLHDGAVLYALYGHLSTASLEGKQPGQAIKAGEAIAWIGNQDENGGWPPHVHFQLSREAPDVCDMHGVVAEDRLAESLERYPDPRMVLGQIF